MPVRPVAIADYWDEALPLMHANWAETGFDFPFAPSRERYVRQQAAGFMFAIGAFAPEGIAERLVGYSTAIVVAHPFNPDAVHYCCTDALFVQPEHRGSILAGRLLLATEREAKQRGATWISWHTRAGTPFAAMLERHGYAPGDVVVFKEL